MYGILFCLFCVLQAFDVSWYVIGDKMWIMCDLLSLVMILISTSYNVSCQHGRGSRWPQKRTELRRSVSLSFPSGRIWILSYRTCSVQLGRVNYVSINRSLMEFCCAGSFLAINGGYFFVRGSTQAGFISWTRLTKRSKIQGIVEHRPTNSISATKPPALETFERSAFAWSR